MYRCALTWIYTQITRSLELFQGPLALRHPVFICKVHGITVLSRENPHFVSCLISLTLLQYANFLWLTQSRYCCFSSISFFWLLTSGLLGQPLQRQSFCWVKARVCNGCSPGVWCWWQLCKCVCVVCSFSGSPRLPAVMTQQPGEFVVPYPAWLQTREVKVYFFSGLTSSFFCNFCN